jgi:hypothetical protein
MAVFIFGFIYTPALGWIQNKVFPIVSLALARLFCLAESFVVLGMFLDDISAQTPIEFILFSSGPSVM